MTTRAQARACSALAFLACLAPALFLGITLIGHTRGLPYVSAWVDRLVLVATALALPALAAFGVHRLVSRRGASPKGRG